MNSAYAKGVDEISLQSDQDYYPDLNQNMGYAVVSQKKDKMIIRDISGTSNENLDDIFKRVYQMIIGFYDKAIEDIFSDNNATKEMVFEQIPPSLSWYGGEPLLRFEFVKRTARYFLGKPWDKIGISRSQLSFQLTSNLSLLDENIAEFLVSHNVWLYVSLDGPQKENDKHRMYPDGRGTYSIVSDKLKLLRKRYPLYYSQRVIISAVKGPCHEESVCSAFFDTM